MVTVWTTHVSVDKPITKASESGAGSTTFGKREKMLKVSIVPERDRGCHFRVVENDLGTVGRLPMGKAWYQVPDRTRAPLWEGMTRLRNIGKLEKAKGKGMKSRVLVFVKMIGVIRRGEFDMMSPYSVLENYPWTYV